jgi:uncharacterized protein YggE
MKQRIWVVVSIVLAFALVGVAPAAAQDDGEPAHVISVTGYGEAFGAPDVAYLQLGVSASSEEIGEVVTSVNQTLDAISVAMLQVGVAQEDLQTANFSLWADERYDDNGSTGERYYRADNTLRVIIRDVNNIETVIEAGLAAGATNIYGLTFGIDDATELEQAARLNAIADAQDRAAKLAAALGLGVGAPISVSETDGGGVYAVSEVAMYSGSGLGGGGAVVEEGQLSVSVQVSITFAIAE